MQQALYQAAIVTFEELGFMFPVQCLDDAAIDAAKSVRVAIDFSGEFGGRFVLQVEEQVLPVIASNMLGEDAPFEKEMLHDVLGEIANVICGNTLPEIGGRRSVFNLTAPQIVETAETVEPTVVANLDLEDGRADVLLYLN